MRGLLVGVFVGIVLGFVATRLLDPPAAPEPPAPSASLRPAPVEVPELDPVAPPAAEPRLQGQPRIEGETTGFAPGTIVLHVGEGYRFGARQAERAGDGARHDLICYEIAEGLAVVATPHGGAPARMPLVGAGVDWDALGPLFDRLLDAPDALEAETLRLAEKPDPSHRESGFGLVADSKGKMHKLRIERIDMHADVLQRRVVLRHEHVPSTAGGGFVDVPGGIATTSVAPDDATQLVALLAPPAGIEIGAWGYHADRVVRVGSLPDQVKLSGGDVVRLDGPFETHVETNGPFGLHVRGDTLPSSELHTRSFASCVVDGDFQGTWRNRSFGILHVRGDLTGEVRASSFTLLIVDGGLYGKVKMNTITQVLLRGPVPEPMTSLLGGRGSYTLYRPGRTDMRDLASWPVGKEVYLETSDLGPGVHEDIEGWKRVIVGDHEAIEWANLQIR